MDVVIKLKPEELTDDFYKELKSLAKGSKRIEITLDDVDEMNNLSEKEIDERFKELSDNKTVSFTMQEFESYIQSIAG